MRKCFTYALLIIFLLNAVGFYGIFLGVQFEYSRHANELIDHNERLPDNAVTFKVAVSLPYASETEFERVTGEFEHEGDVYRLVKQKLSHDTLFLVCVKDRVSNDIKQALTDYVKTFSDKPFNAKQQSKVTLTLIKDYITTGVDIEPLSRGWSNDVDHGELATNYQSLFGARIKYPPKKLSIG